MGVRAVGGTTDPVGGATDGGTDGGGPVTGLRIAGHVAALTAYGPRHRSNSTGVTVALRYLTDTLSGFGYQVEVEPWGSDPDEVNLVARLPRLEPYPAPVAGVLEIGAHWDTVPGSPGADDNASGVAGLLELARTLRAPAGARDLGRPVRFCLYGGEESPEQPFPGSTAHVTRLRDVVAGAIVLEMIGYRSTAPGSQRMPADLHGLIDVPPAGDFIAVVADAGSARLAAAVTAAARSATPPVAVLPLVIPDRALHVVGRSDHVPYWWAGLPAIMVTDTANYRNPHYHTAGDVLSTLDCEFAAAVTGMVARVVLDLCAAA